MKKLFLLAAVALSLSLMSYGIVWSGSSAAMPMPQVSPEAAETPSPIPQVSPEAAEAPSPVPTLTLDKRVVGKPGTDLDGDGKIAPGDTISYTISYSNTGHIAATNVILRDEYDETLIEGIAKITKGGKEDKNTITWELGTLAGEGEQSGSVSYEATLKKTLPPDTTALENEATISSNETEPISVTETVKMEVLPTPTPIPPTLTLDKRVAGKPGTDLDGDGKIAPGDTISYTISYSNTGQITATNVILCDVYDETLIKGIAKITGGGKEDKNTITWELGTLAGRKDGSVSYEATLKKTLPPGTTALENEATISSDEVEPVRAPKTVPVKRPKLTIAKASEEIDLDEDGVIGGGDIIKYKITYTNTGDAAAANVVIVDDYPETVIARIDNILPGGEKDGGTITWELDTVGAGKKDSLTYQVTLKSKFPPGTTSVDNEAKITSAETYPSSVTETVPIKVPNLTIAKEKAPGLIKDLNDNGIVDPGDTIKYMIAYENKGDADASEVIIVDDYPETLITSIPNISGDGKEDGDTITWNLGTLTAGKSGSLSYEATLKGTLPLGPTNVQNPTTIFSKETEPTSVTATVKVEVAPTPTPEPTPKPEETGPATGIFAQMPLLPSVLIGFLAIVAMIVLAYVGAIAKYSSDDENKRELNRQRIAMVREGVFLIFLVSAILILAIGRGIEPDGAISILSAIVGYVFGRATRPT